MALDVTTSKRVAAVKAFATEHYEDGGWDIVVESMNDQEIYSIIKKARTPRTAILAMAKHIGAKAEYRTEVQAMAGEGKSKRAARTSKQIAQSLKRAEGMQPDKSICAHCFAEVGSLEDLQTHSCEEVLNSGVKKPEVTDAEVDAVIEEIEVNLTDYVEPTDEQKDKANAEYLVDAEAHELNLDAPNGYFKNGNPKPVSKKDMERLIEEARKGNGGEEPQH